MHPHHDSITTGSRGPPGSPGSLDPSEVPPLQHLLLPFKLIDFRARMTPLDSGGGRTGGNRSNAKVGKLNIALNIDIKP